MLFLWFCVQNLGVGVINKTAILGVCDYIKKGVYILGKMVYNIQSKSFANRQSFCV